MRTARVSRASYLRAFVLVSTLTMILAYFGYELVVPLSFGRGEKVLAGLGLCLPFFFVAWLPLVYWRRPRGRTPSPLLQWSYLSMGFLSLLFTFLLVRDGVALAMGIAGANWPLLYGDRPTLAMIATTLLLLAWGVNEGRRIPKVCFVRVPIANLPPQWENFRILQVSDLHIGTSIRRPFVQSVVERVNAHKPDMVALTGDLVDGDPLSLREDFAPLEKLTSPYGSFYVTGNHEYYSGAARWVEEARSRGLIPLMNSHRLIHRDGAVMVIAGVTDFSAGYFSEADASSPARAIAGAPKNVPKVLLAHQPKSAPEAEKAGFDLQLSGHTHGGQFIPWVFIVHLFHPVSRGLKHVGRMWVYVSLGTGSWGPRIRLGSPAEITCLELHCA